MIALALLAVFASDSRGQSKQPSSQTKETAQPRANDQRGTDQVPLAVKILPAQDAKEKADKEDHERQEKSKVDEKLAFETQRIADYTARLSLFTIFLFGVAALQAALFTWQLLLIQSSASDTKRAVEAAAAAADAAKLNAQAVIDSEQAYIFVNIERSNMELFQQAATYEGSHDISAGNMGAVEIIFSIKNYGKTPAFFKELSHQIVIGPNFPAEPSYEFARPMPVSLVLGAGETSQKIAVSAESVLTVAVAKSVYASESSLWFYGFVSYDDAFGFGQEFRYIWHYNGQSGGLRCVSARPIKSLKPH